METRWVTLGLIIQIVEVVGWIVVLAGAGFLIFALTLLSGGEKLVGALSLFNSFITMLIGLLAVCFGQAMKVFIAIEKNTRHTSQHRAHAETEEVTSFGSPTPDSLPSQKSSPLPEKTPEQTAAHKLYSEATDLQFEQKRSQEALEKYKEVIEKYPESEEARFSKYRVQSIQDQG